MNGTVYTLATQIATERLAQAGLSLTPGLLDSELRLAYLQATAQDGRIVTSLSGINDYIALGTALGLTVAARALSASLSGGGAVTQIKTAEGGAMNFAAPSGVGADGLMSEASSALSLVSFIKADRVSTAAGFSLCQVNGRSRQAVRAIGCAPNWAAYFGAGLLDFGLYPFGGAV